MEPTISMWPGSSRNAGEVVSEAVKAERLRIPGVQRPHTLFNFLRRRRWRVLWLLAMTTIFGLNSLQPALLLTSPPQMASFSKNLGLTLISQNSWVAPGNTFVINLNAATGNLSGLKIVAQVFPRLVSRSELALSFQGEELGPPLAYSPSISERSLETSPGKIQFSVATSTKSKTAANMVMPSSAQCVEVCPGVYPLVVGLENPSTGTIEASITTQIIVVAKASNPLQFTWVLPFSAQPKFAKNGELISSASATSRLLAQAKALSGTASGSPMLAVDPATLKSLADTHTKTANSTLHLLANWAKITGHVVIGQPFAPLNLSILTKARLTMTLPPIIALAKSTTTSALGISADNTTWLAGHHLNNRGLQLIPRQVKQIIIPAQDLQSETSNLTPDQPFVINGRTGTKAIAADQSLANLLPQRKAPIASSVLKAHEMLAELAQIYLEAPNDPLPRGVVLDIPRSSLPPASFVTVLQEALGRSPVVKTTAISGMFSAVPVRIVDHHPETRYLVSSYRSNAERIPVVQLQHDKQVLGALKSMVGRREDALSPLWETLAVAEADYGTYQYRLQAISAFSAAQNALLGGLSLSGDHTLTLTSRTGRIPLTIVSNSGVPLRALVRLASDKLAFPGGSTQLVKLQGHNDTISFLVQARATGDFPLTVKIFTPSGKLLLLDQRFTVQSTAFSVVGVILTGSAIIFLILWWGRSIIMGHRTRNKHLVPPSH